MNWHTEKPKENGEYLVTVSEPMQFNRFGVGESYVYKVDVAEYDGEWNKDVVAWSELPEPYFP